MTAAPRALDLDFRAVRPTASWTPWVLLALAIGYAADLGVTYYQARESTARAEASLARLERSGRGATLPRARNVSPEEISAAREAYLKLALSWSELFATLETVPHAKVTLVSIEPDTKSGTVVISGEAADYPAVLEYVTELQRAKLLSRVYLLRHELRQGDQQRVAAFSVSAAWSEAR